MLDKSLPYIGVLMETHTPADYPRYSLPEGWRICAYQPGFEHGWARIHFTQGQTESLEEAQTIFEETFSVSPAERDQNCFFALTPDGEIAGTASLWTGKHFGKQQYRIHWVATDPKYGGRGICKALLTRVFDRFQELGGGEYLYLTSQTWSWRALRIYTKFGFQPYFGEQPPEFTCSPILEHIPTEFRAQNREAWRLIDEKIRAYQSGLGETEYVPD